MKLVKKLMYKFCCDYIKPKYQYNAKLCYMDTYSFIFHIKTEDVYEDIADDVEKRFDTSNYEVNRPLSTGKNMKDELGEKVWQSLLYLDQKYIYLMDESSNDKKAKGTKMIIKMLTKQWNNISITRKI